jgi:molybdopterin converting factor small subunit
MLTIQYFASVREKLGKASEQIHLPDRKSVV